MTPIYRMMEPRDVKAVQYIHSLCHPKWPERSELWWHSHPTLVLEDGDVILGSTSYSVSIATDRDFERRGAEIAYGHGASVRPEWRGHGFGLMLCQARASVLRELGIRFFVGFTQPENAAVLAIFKRMGLTFHARLPKSYPDGGDALMFTGGV